MNDYKNIFRNFNILKKDFLLAAENDLAQL